LKLTWLARSELASYWRVSSKGPNLTFSGMALAGVERRPQTIRAEAETRWRLLQQSS
jgi:hypothetical protein